MRHISLECYQPGIYVWRMVRSTSASELPYKINMKV